MGYIGNQQTGGYSQVPPKQDLTGATGTTLTLSNAVASAEGIDLFINNVRQEPTEAYSVGGDGVTVTLTGSVVATDDIYVVYNSLARQTSTHPSNQALQATSGTFSGTVTANAFSGDGSSLTGVGVAGISSSSTSGTALSIDANNIVTTPNVPSFHAYSPPSPSAGNIVTGYTVGHDTGSNFNASTGRFTCPVSGVYLFQATAGSSSSFGIDIRKNSNTIRRIEVGVPNSFTWSGDSIIITMSANDYAEVYCFLGTPSMGGGNAGFSGCLIG